MKNQTDLYKGPGVYIPPPLFYVLFYFIGIILQKNIPVHSDLFNRNVLNFFAVILLLAAIYFIARSLFQFFKTKNTVILIKRATALQTNNIYAFTRNPMYLGLALVYLAITCIFGNWWHIIIFPLLIIFVQEYIIKKEEKYLEKEFGEEYLNYKKKVRRWI
ncbi:MAG TPA: isoprenylcysteine carboxylmethyltransferase family protein [Bacteroidia bacterium]|nr:isoprenylcysteine carboxylmethyltransferase family protein [Bacteroidia bacterium]HNR49536.1 isoprenylcysteine carboxylmethyltransferase family protein [Bacteroidia bacterium]HNT83162.1 isoprenylcysteine carboxylmethyltransferase family protein [Bacteroidia bacterium]